MTRKKDFNIGDMSKNSSEKKADDISRLKMQLGSYKRHMPNKPVTLPKTPWDEQAMAFIAVFIAYPCGAVLLMNINGLTINVFIAIMQSPISICEYPMSLPQRGEGRQ